jgi:hypothetical protein
MTAGEHGGGWSLLYMNKKQRVGKGRGTRYNLQSHSPGIYFHQLASPKFSTSPKIAPPTGYQAFNKRACGIHFIFKP